MISYLHARFPQAMRTLEFLEGMSVGDDHDAKIPLGELRQILAEYHELAGENTTLGQMASQLKDENKRLKKEVAEYEIFVEQLSDRHDQAEAWEQ